MIVGQIKDGIVLDHITAGRGMEIYNILGLDKLDCTVAMIKNADSVKMGKKDIIKIAQPIDLDVTILGYIDPGITVNVIKNVKSDAMGRKDIIKIDEDISIDLDVLGYIDPGITVDIIDDGRIVEKKHLELPQKLVNVIRCKNPRCITSCEQELVQEFRLVNAEKQTYRCIYCDSEVSRG